MPESPAAFKLAVARHHAAIRVRREFGIRLDSQHLAAIEGRIVRTGADRDEGCVPLRPDHRDPSNTLYGVKVAGAWLPVVFDPRRGAVVTVLAATALAPFLRVLEPVERPPAPTPDDLAREAVLLRAEVHERQSDLHSRRRGTPERKAAAEALDDARDRLASAERAIRDMRQQRSLRSA